VLWLCTGAAPAESSVCEPSPEVGQQIESASKGLASPTLNLEEVIEPLRELRRRLPKDLFVHARYQDAIKERGVEGHLKQMLDEYLALRNEHAKDPFLGRSSDASSDLRDRGSPRNRSKFCTRASSAGRDLRERLIP
jgi:hypothetical protein